jgi:hypothetical protein
MHQTKIANAPSSFAASAFAGPVAVDADGDDDGLVAEAALKPADRQAALQARLGVRVAKAVERPLDPGCTLALDPGCLHHPVQLIRDSLRLDVAGRAREYQHLFVRSA